jgi:hypothetical protein
MLSLCTRENSSAELRIEPGAGAPVDAPKLRGASWSSAGGHLDPAE